MYQIFEIVKNQTSVRSLSVLVYLSLTYFGVTWRKVDIFLKQLGAFSAEICNRWSEVFIQGDLDEFFEDNRGGNMVLVSSISILSWKVWLNCMHWNPVKGNPPHSMHSNWLNT